MDPSELPGLYWWADDVAARGRRRLLAGTRVRLSLTVVVAVIAVVLTPLDDQHVKWSALAAAAGLLAAVFVDVALLQMRPERDCVEGAALAAAVESQAWRFAVAGEPYPAPHLKAEAFFLEQLGGLTAGGGDLGVSAMAGAPPITDGMRALRAAPFRDRKEAYLRGRLGRLSEKYIAQTGHHARCARRWQLFVLGAEATGVCAALVSALLWRVNLAGVAATIVAAAVAWLETRQHQNLAETYSVAARQLDLVMARVDQVQRSVDWARAVDNAEDSIQPARLGLRSPHWT